MIISKTPFRMSFFGGGTDIESYFREKGGAVLSTTFDKYCYITIRELPCFFPYSSEFVYSKIERVTNNEEIQHPAIREVLKALDIKNIRLNYDADLPARSGLGSSSSFAVGMLNALHALYGHDFSKEVLANEAIFLERKLCNEAGGWQDQIAASFGGFNRINFNKSGYEVVPLKVKKEKLQELNSNLLMFFTGITRFSSDIQKAAKNSKSNTDIIYSKMLDILEEAENILVGDNHNLDEFGTLLNQSWELKKSSSSVVTNSIIDDYYKKAMEAGALGGKLLGAGGGGFLVFYVPKDKQEKVIAALNNLLLIPFNFENDGTQILYSDNNNKIERNLNEFRDFEKRATEFINK